MNSGPPDYPLTMVGGESDRERLRYGGHGPRVRIPLRPDMASVGVRSGGAPVSGVDYQEYELTEIHFPDTKSVFFWRHTGLAPMQALNRVLNEYSKLPDQGSGVE